MAPANSFFWLIPFFLCAKVQGQSPTFYGEIKPILEKHCSSCHSAGEVGAMPLSTYEEVAAYGKMIQYVTTSRLMPPWYADASYSHFSNENLLTDEEIDKIRTWVDHDMPEGAISTSSSDSKKLKKPTHQRKPDLVLSMPEAFEQYGIYLDHYQVFIIPIHLQDDQWIEGIQFIPGNKKIVRGVTVSIARHGQFDSLEQWDPRPGYYTFGGLGKVPDQPYWYSWSPTEKTSWFLPGQYKLLPKESDLVVHFHYGPTGTSQFDSSSIQLFFADKKPTHPVITAPLINPFSLTVDSFFIPANTQKMFHASYRVPFDIQVLSLTPQANLLCRSWEIFAEIPGQDLPVKLLKIKDWNFYWNQAYRLEAPITLPKGTVLHCLALYDNTSLNVCNPADPLIDFQWGAHLFKEMFFVHFEYSPVTTYSTEFNLPVTSSDENVPFSLNVPEQGEYSIQFLKDNKNILTINKNLPSGDQSLDIDLKTLPNGNYVVRVLNDQHQILAEQVFFKMPAQGM
jgi:hypothetical protein